MKRISHYFAYGSNMNPARAAARIPGALDIGRAALDDHRLVERLYADIEPRRGATVHGVLYRVGDAEMAALDRFEGYPAVYGRKVVSVRWRGRLVRAWTYFMVEPTVGNRRGLRYPDWYRALCRDGAKAHGLTFKETETMNKNEPIRVAVYGTLLTGECNYDVGADALGRAPCRLRGMLYDPHYGFPAFVPEGSGDFGVAGEVLTVTPAIFARLDRLEGYPNLYDRRRVPVLLEDGSRVNAWVYVMRRLPANAEVIASGDWRAYRRR